MSNKLFDEYKFNKVDKIRFTTTEKFIIGGVVFAISVVLVAIQVLIYILF